MSTRRALLFSFLDRYSALVLSIVSSMFIARLLSPADIGVFSVTMVLIGFISALRDLGAGQYLVQERELTPAKISATWTVLLLTGLFMAGVVALAAYPVSRFYGEPRILEIMLVIALNFAVNPFGSMTYAWLMREMRFDALAVMRFGGGLAGAITSVYLAWQGHGPISLAFGNLLSTLVNAALAIYFRPPHFALMPRWTGVRQVVAFGSKISATSLIANLASGAPELFLGKLQSMTAAGLYSRGNGLVGMFQRLMLDATQSVALPLFAKAKRETGDLREPFLRTVSYVTALGWPFFLGLMALSFPLTRLLYGDQWDGAVDLTRLLALGMVIALPAAMCSQALMAAGRSDELLRIMAVVVAVQVICTGVGATFGLMEAGAGYVLAQCVSMPVWLNRTLHVLGVRWRDLLTVLRASALLSCATAIAPLAVFLAAGSRPSAIVAPIVASAVFGTALFVVAARYLEHPIYEELMRITKRIRMPGQTR